MMHVVEPASAADFHLKRVHPVSSARLAWGVEQPLPATLRRAVEFLSGYDMADVRVFVNSTWPALVGARAFTHGSDIYLSRGAEDALAHEAWHVAQQKQGRVRMTMEVNGIALNDDPALEKEADMMGAMAAALSWSGTWSQAKRIITKVRIKKPIGQRHVLVSGNRYEAVANQTTMVRGMAEFLQDIDTNTSLSGEEIPDINTIATDLIAENLEFTNWIAIAKEIEIRNVGYAVESTMRRMYEDNRVLDLEYQQRVASGAYSSAELRAFDEKILRWEKQSFPIYEYRDRQLIQWLLGERTEEPRRLNCWECVLLALVKTAPGNVNKNYMIWATERETGTPRIANELVSNMDYYLPRFGTPVLNAAKERFRPADDTFPCFNLPPPNTFVIPRGRIVLFDKDTHFAISTGKPVRIKTTEWQQKFNRLMGHGILDLNGQQHTIRERTIEECVEPYGARRFGGEACNNRLLVAPFPICNDTKNIYLRGTIPPTPEEIDAYQKSLNEAATAAYEKELSRLDEIRKKATTANTESPQNIDTRYRREAAKAKEKYEKAVVTAYSKLQKKVQSLYEVKPAPTKESLALRYGPADPYNGKVEF